MSARQLKELVQNTTGLTTLRLHGRWGDCGRNGHGNRLNKNLRCSCHHKRKFRAGRSRGRDCRGRESRAAAEHNDSWWLKHRSADDSSYLKLLEMACINFGATYH